MKNLLKTMILAPVAVGLAASAQAADLSILDKADAVATQAAAAGQVTSISQLSEVKPTDWAYQALQSLVERYGCIVGYPNKSYQGNKALSRYEFAAGLNTCIDKITEYAASKEDLETLKRLLQEFQTELASLRGRVDALDARVAELQAQQFTTTTKLQGSVILSLDQAYNPSGTNTGISFASYVDLNFNTSFTGKDLLKLSIKQININSPATRGVSAISTGNVSYPGAALDYDYLNVIPGEPIGNGNFFLSKLYYKFPVEKFTFTVGASNLRVVDIFSQTGTFYTSVFNYSLGSAPTNVYGDADISGTGGLGFNWEINKNFNFGTAWTPQQAFVSGQANTGGGNSGGLFGLGQQFTTQLNWKSDNGSFVGAISYAWRAGQGNNSQQNDGGVGYGTFRALLGPDTVAGCSVSTSLTGGTLCPTTVVTSNNLGITLGYAFNPNFTLSGAFGYSWLASASGQTSQVAEWMIGATFPNLFASGNQGSLAIGQLPWVTTASKAGAADTGNFAVEAGYKFQITDNISITPGFFLITNAGGGLGPDGMITVPVIKTKVVF